VLLGMVAVSVFKLALGSFGRDPYLVAFFQQLISINIALAAFNFLPIPPLDGFSLARLVLPRSISAVLEQYGMIILIILVFLPSFLGRQFDFLSMLVRPIQLLIQSIVLSAP
jgi:Zn-dependent protease